MDYKFVNNNSNILIIVFNSNNYSLNKFEFENYLNNLFKNYKNIPSFLFLKDIYLQWYSNGIKNFSNSYEDTIIKINNYVKKYNFNNLICMGSSSGGYASLYFGCKLNVNNIICFSPQIELTKSVNLYYNKFRRKYNSFNNEKKNKFNLVKLINNYNNNIYIFWVNYKNFFNISKRENTYVYQNLNDEYSYNLLKNHSSINHYFADNCNHGDVAKTIVKNGLLDKILKLLI